MPRRAGCGPAEAAGCGTTRREHPAWSRIRGVVTSSGSAWPEGPRSRRRPQPLEEMLRDRERATALGEAVSLARGFFVDRRVGAAA